MKFKIVRSKFFEGLKAVQNVVASKGSLPVLQNVLIETAENSLKLTTTDLDLSISCSVECEVVEQGATTMPVKLLSSSVMKLAEGVVEFDVDANERALIISGNAKYRLAGLPASDFPQLPQEDGAYSYRLSSQMLRNMIRKTAYAAAQDDTRRTLKGVLMSFKEGKLTMVATDGRRLALMEHEFEFPKTEERDIVLPSKAVQELQRSLLNEGDVEMSVQASQIKFKFGEVNIYSKLMDDAYPNYRQVIPNETAQTVQVDRQLLLDALDRASVMTMDESHSTKLIFEGNKLTVTSAASDIGEASDEVDIKYAGERIEVLFNPSYVMDPLKAIDDDEVKINLNDGHSPAVIKCAEPFLYVLMPLRSN